MPILIKRYANRKLYNTESSRYITLKGIAKLLDEGEEVRVIDNESGEDITQIALSQILVGNQRAKEDPSDTLLSQILTKGGDALYGAIKKSVDDASDGLGEFQDRFRKIVNQSESMARNAREAAGFPDRADEADSDDDDRRRRGPWSRRSSSPFAPRSTSGSESTSEPRSASRTPGSSSPDEGGSADDLEEIVQEAVARVFDAQDLPRRSDLEKLTLNLERVAVAVERLESVYREEAKADGQDSENDV